jgi:hypothetical protein
MKKLDKHVAIEIVGTNIKPWNKRTKLAESTFGQDSTIGYKLKRKGAYFIGDVQANDMFGHYLGLVDGKYYVGVLNLYSEKDYNATEVFDTLEEMNQHWVIN